MAEEDEKRPESEGLKGTRAGQRRRVPPTIDLAPSEVTPVAEARSGLADEPLDPASEVPLDAALPAEPGAPTHDPPPASIPANGSRMTDTDRAASTAPPPGGGIGNTFAAAVLGALAALILVYFVAALGLLPSNDRRAAEALERVTALQQS
ncbi:MAG: hypothetical protein IT535_01445, partial [Bauldia sp.]|nr:hypothetical protein [Bauldia sp.]